MCPGDPDGAEVRGAEVELSMLFADIRGSSKLARQLSSLEFTQLMDRFYRASSEVLVEHDAIIEKFVGDEVVGLFLPFLAGPDHAARAVEAARALSSRLRAMGPPRDRGCHWAPECIRDRRSSGSSAHRTGAISPRSAIR